MAIESSRPPQSGGWAALQAQPSRYLIPFLSSLPNLGVTKYWRILDESGDLKSFFSWPRTQLLRVIPSAAEEIFNDINRLGEKSTYWTKSVALCRQVESEGVTILTHEMSTYPSLLRNVSNYPPVLYIKGSVAALSQPQLAFVGSRQGSASGRETAFSFARYLASTGITITSGLAEGIDASAHRGALAAAGCTVAVMGTGIDRIYPARHADLATEIVTSGGALVSEFMPGTKPHSGNFPRRNRIISGLSLGVLVVEAAIRSGSLITARYAAEQNRDVFAVPGSIHNPLSRGCHALLREGATLVDLEGGALTPECNTNDSADSLWQELRTDSERKLWQSLDDNPSDLDILLERSQISAAEALSLLMGWVIEGRVRQSELGFERISRGTGLG